MHALDVEHVLDVDVEDPRVGVRRAQHRGVQGVLADGDVVDVPALAAQEPLVLDPLDLRARSAWWSCAAPAVISAARCTDFTMFW